MIKKRAALCIRGAVAKKHKRCDKVGEIYTDTSEYVKYTSVYKSILRHIVLANPEYNIDIFIHCWNLDLEEDLVSLYKPVKYTFEDNNKYADDIISYCISPNDFGGISQALSIRKVLEIQEEYAVTNKVNYDIIVLFRPDVLIWTDMILSKYDLDYLYTDGHEDNNGDLFFVMSPEHAILFKDLYLSLRYGNRHAQHLWIKHFLIKWCNIPIQGDTLIPGRHYEVLRHIYQTSITNNHITYQTLEGYDILPCDIEQRKLY
jgi:hypothetical protein